MGGDVPWEGCQIQHLKTQGTFTQHAPRGYHLLVPWQPWGRDPEVRAELGCRGTCLQASFAPACLWPAPAPASPSLGLFTGREGAKAASPMALQAGGVKGWFGPARRAGAGNDRSACRHDFVSSGLKSVLNVGRAHLGGDWLAKEVQSSKKPSFRDEQI